MSKHPKHTPPPTSIAIAGTLIFTIVLAYTYLLFCRLFISGNFPLYATRISWAVLLSLLTVAASISLNIWAVQRAGKKSLLKRFILVPIILSLAFIGSTAYLALPNKSHLSGWINRTFFERRYTITTEDLSASHFLSSLEPAISEHTKIAGELYIQPGFSINVSEDKKVTAAEGQIYSVEHGFDKVYSIIYKQVIKNDTDNKTSGKLSVYEYTRDASFPVDEDLKLIHAINSIEPALQNKSTFYHALNVLDDANHISLHDGFNLTYQGNVTNSPGSISVITKVKGDVTTISISDATDVVYAGVTTQLKLPDTAAAFPNYINFVLNPTEIGADTLDANASQATVAALNNDSYTIDSENTLIYRYNETTSYRMNVVDAAAGSYFYELQKSTDQSISWKTINQNPYLNSAGLASEMRFIDDKLGFFTLAKGDTAELYMTADGGKTTTQVMLPFERVTNISPELAQKSYADSPDSYRYIHVPTYNKSTGELTVLVSVDASIPDGIAFSSDDMAKTWHVIAH